MGKKSFSMQMKKNVKFKQGSDLEKAIERSGTVADGAKAVINAMKANTPVVTGNLKGRWGTVGGKGSWDGSTFRETVVNTAPYAGRVDRTSKRNAGYIRRGLTQAQTDAIRAMKARFAGIGVELWSQEKG